MQTGSGAANAQVSAAVLRLCQQRTLLLTAVHCGGCPQPVLQSVVRLPAYNFVHWQQPGCRAQWAYGRD